MVGLPEGLVNASAWPFRKIVAICAIQSRPGTVSGTCERAPTIDSEFLGPSIYYRPIVKQM